MRSDVWTVHWEGALGAWLRGQLDARGIDAPYGRYVLSLLTRPMQPADLSPDTIEGAKTWERRNKNKWGPVKIEALKRAAAVQCLTNASDEESSDIEQLVDELCLKIKEVEEVGGSRRDRASQVTRARRERRRTLSPREMARLYYAAFPALGPESTPDKLPAARTWPSRRNTLHAPAPPKHKSRRAPRIQPSQPRHPPHPPHSQPVQLPEWVTHPDTWDYDSQDPIQDFVKSITMDEGYGTCDNTVADEIIGSKRLYERDSDSGDTDDVLLFNDWVIEDDLCFRPKSRNEEESIAMFKAKFSTMENLWATDEPIVIPNANATDNDEDYQELPVDLQVLLSSPSDKIFECCESPDKALPASLTASIWSNNDTNQEYESGDFTSRNEDYQPSTYGSDVGFNLYPNNSNLWQNETESYSKESMEQIYNKLQPLNLDDSEETSCAIDVNNFDFKDDTVYVTPPTQTSNRSSMLDPYSLHCYDDVLESVPAATTAIRSLTALNHNPLYSSFTEVIPKSTAGYVGDGIKKKNNLFKLDIPPIKSSPKEDDDLLTSMRTHFRPIKRESATTTQAVVSYDNGVTFPIISDLDEVKFSRSSSGSLFLESDMEPPKQYMEYRTQGIDYARLDISPSADGSDDGGLACTDLILKFKVCQTDMSVQTEEVGAKIESSPKAIDADRILSGCSSSASSLVCLDNSAHSEDKFCPILDIDSELESLQLNWIQCEKCKIDSDSWSSIPLNNQVSWHPMYNSTKIWSLDDNFCKACSELQAEEKAKRKTSKKALVYKEEAAREWEELLSDISYAHHLQTDSDETTSPSDIYDIAPKEITIRATDGNFIRSALMAQQQDEEEDKWPQVEGKGFNIVGSILKQSLSLYSGKKRGGGGGDRKRRHSAGGAGGAGKLRCPLPAPPAPSRPSRPLQPLLAAVDRPLTR